MLLDCLFQHQLCFVRRNRINSDQFHFHFVELCFPSDCDLHGEKGLGSNWKRMEDQNNDQTKVWCNVRRTFFSKRSLCAHMALLFLAETTFDGYHCYYFPKILVDADIPLFNEHHHSDNHHWRIELFWFQIKKINGVRKWIPNHANALQHDQLFTVRARHRDKVQNGLLLLPSRSCCSVCQSVAYYALKCKEHDI